MSAFKEGYKANNMSRCFMDMAKKLPIVFEELTFGISVTWKNCKLGIKRLIFGLCNFRIVASHSISVSQYSQQLIFRPSYL